MYDINHKLNLAHTIFALSWLDKKLIERLEIIRDYEDNTISKWDYTIAEGFLSDFKALSKELYSMLQLPAMLPYDFNEPAYLRTMILYKSFLKSIITNSFAPLRKELKSRKVN